MGKSGKEKVLSERWWWRRMVALICLASMLFIIGFVLIASAFSPQAADGFEKVTMLIGGSITVLGGIVVTWYGTAAYEHGKEPIDAK